MTDLRTLMRSAAADPDPATDDLGEVLAQGRRRVRRRRLGAVVGASAVVLAAVAAPLTLDGLLGEQTLDPPVAGAGPGEDIVGPRLRLQDAAAARPGVDYDVLLDQRNPDLEARNGVYFQGVTEDGWAIREDGPHGVDNRSNWALVDTDSGGRIDLPEAPRGQLRVIEATEDRLVFGTWSGDRPPEIVLFDRGSNRWRVLTYRALGDSGDLRQSVVGPDGRLYLTLESSPSGPTLEKQAVPAEPTSAELQPEPLPEDEIETDDSGAEGTSYRLWSVSLTDQDDVRDEGTRVGAFAFADDALLWTDRDNGVSDRVHVRDLTTGEERSFDPHSGARCNVIGFSAFSTSDGIRIAISQYCGTYSAGRDDRVQIVTDEGEPVVTLQDDGLLEGGAVGDLVQVVGYGSDVSGNYVYDPGSGRFLRLGESRSIYDMGGPTPPGYLIWDEALNGTKGAHQYVGRLK